MLGAVTAVIIPSLNNRGIPYPVQDSSPSFPSPRKDVWTPTPPPSLPQPSIPADEQAFLAGHDLIHGDTARNVVMITYDDAKDSARVNHILDVYREYGMHTTFFIIGTDLDACKESLPRIIAEGHDLGCHGWDHLSPMTSLADNAINHQFGEYLYKVNQYLPDYQVKFFRAPFGDRNDRVRALAAGWGMQHVLWSLESGGEDKSTYHNVVDRVQPGDIVLSHAFRYFDVNDAEVIVRELIRKGYNLESLSTGTAPADQWKAS
jgi:peptidoglycan-N-acetylglucosamine deacetylase